jgi:hypothetical protein
MCSFTDKSVGTIKNQSRAAWMTIVIIIQHKMRRGLFSRRFFGHCHRQSRFSNLRFQKFLVAGARVADGNFNFFLKPRYMRRTTNTSDTEEMDHDLRTKCVMREEIRASLSFFSRCDLFRTAHYLGRASRDLNLKFEF